MHRFRPSAIRRSPPKSAAVQSFGAVFAEVRIDRELGIIRVPRVVARYDVGKLLNIKTGRSQLSSAAS